MQSFTITKDRAYRVKRKAEYPWPCDGEPNRTMLLFPDYDVLTKDNIEGTYIKHTGVCCVGIKIPDKDVELWGEDKHLG